MPKFRSMKVETPQVASHLLNDSRIFLTPIGRFIRRTSLDELPQLFNILSNDLSLFGHRPLMHRQVDFLPLSARIIRRNKKPGLIGHSIISDKSQLSIYRDFT